MEILTEEGELFGVVNIVDALVVLLVLSVLVAGVAVVGVLGAEEEEPKSESETRYATVDFGPHAESAATAVEVGDYVEHSDENDTLTVAQRETSPAGDGDVAVTALVELTGSSNSDDVFTHGGEPLHVGDNISVETDAYEMTGEVLTVEEEEPSLETTETEVVVEQTVSTSVAEDIVEGASLYGPDELSGEISDVSVTPIDDNESELLVGATIETLVSPANGEPVYGGDQIEGGATLALVTEDHTLDGTVVERDTTDVAVNPVTTTVEVDLEGVDPRKEQQLREGMTETVGSETMATVRNVESEPATDSNDTDHDVTLTIELETTETDDRIQYRGDNLYTGDTVEFDFGVTRIEEPVWIVDD